MKPKKQTKFKIENNIPIPSPNATEGMYPFAQLKVNQSFFVKGVVAKRLSARAAEYTRRKNKKRKFVCRTMQGGTRCWRIK